jgi:ADP-heptose:LPS heptosyltransferase
MGDLIQTIGLINAVARLFPSAQIDLLVMKSFSNITNHFQHINNVITFDEEIFSENIAEDMWGAYKELFQTIQSLNQSRYDIIFNPIISYQSGLITYLVNAKQKLGMQITENREQKITCGFSSYMLGNQHNLGDYSFNLVDIFTGMVRDVAENVQKELYLSDFSEFSLSITDRDRSDVSGISVQIKSHSKKVIGFHIGASQSNKAYDTAQYHKVIKHLVAENEFVVVLFGGYKEIEFKPYFADIASDLFYNTIGDFKLNELIAMICDTVDLFVTNDTGPMHIASACHIPLIDISLGPVSKWETGPYNADAIIVEAKLDCHPCSFDHKCQNWQCQHLISPDTIIDIIKKHFYPSDEKVKPPLYDNVRLFRCVKDIFGFQSYLPVYPEALSQKEYLFLIKRFIWSLYFVGKLDAHTDYYREFSARDISRYILLKYDFSHDLQLLQHFITMITQIISCLKTIVAHPHDMNKIKTTISEISQNKKILFDAAATYTLIYDWFWFLLFAESKIDDTKVCDISKKTILLYEKLLTKISILKELLP